MKNKLKNIQTFEQYTDKNLNISDVSDSYYIFFLNSENEWIQSTREIFKSMNDAINYIGDKKRLKVFKMVQ